MAGYRPSATKLTVLPLLLALLSPTLLAAVEVSGTFIAQKSCPAYVSKNKRTNPDQHHLTAGQHYPVFQINRADQPDWYRITLTQAEPASRWVSQQCGKANISTTTAPPANTCSTPNLADSYKLALSWQPAFCETRPTKAECRALTAASPSARQFTLHGLWPNKSSCGRHYGYCGEYKKHNRPRAHCGYPPLAIAPNTRKALEREMPSAAHNSCLQRHEWFKHGTCQTQWDADRYYQIAIQLTQSFNRQVADKIVADNIGKRINSQRFFQVIDNAFGDKAHRRLTLKCHQNKLKDIYINLPSLIDPTQPLAALIQQAEEAFSNRCGEHFEIDAVGF